MSSYRMVQPEGEWALWLNTQRWRLTLPDIPPVTGSSSYRRIRMGMSRLEGQKLLAASVNPATGKTHIVFDLGGTL